MQSTLLSARRPRCILALLITLVLAVPRFAFAFEVPAADGPVEKGQRVFVCGHSFHVFVEKPLATLAKEAGHADHVDLGVDYIGGSYPIQHFKRRGSDNLVVPALKAGNVDVLTLALNRQVPDEGVDKLASLAAEQNPGVRVMLQVSWLPWDGQEESDFKKAEDHNRASVDQLEKLERSGDKYMGRTRDQARALDAQFHRDFVYIVPVGTALVAARKLIVEGKMPGLAKQSDLFKDAMGHPQQPLKNLAAYCWFAAIYRQSPVGLHSLDNPDDKNSRAMNRVLQEIAWEAVTQEPMSGVKAPAAADR